MIADDLLGEAQGYSLLITDAQRADNPIVFANDAFLRLTGYRQEEVLGRTCRFLQGPGTDPETGRAIGEAIRRGEWIEVDLLNYTKHASPFWNRLRIRPVLDDDGEVANYLGLQIPIEPPDSARSGASA